MSRLRLALLIVVAAVGTTALLEWTIGGLDVFRIARLEDLRRLHGVSRVAARSADGAPIAYTLREQVDDWFGGGTIRIRSERCGVRGADPLAVQPAGLRRVVLFGDGAAFGWGVAEPNVIAARVARYLTEGEWEVINAAHPFNRLRDVRRALDAVTVPLEPDLVLVFDRAGPDGMSAACRAVRDGTEPPTPWWGSVLPSIHAVVAELLRGREPTEVEVLDPLDELFVALAGARDDGLPVVFVDLGARPGVDVAAGCHAAGVPYLDARFDARERGRPVYVDATERYPSADGHDLIARKLAAALPTLR